MNVVRIIPVRYSSVTVIAARIISTGTAKMATPTAARSGGSASLDSVAAGWTAAIPRLSTAATTADHSGDRVVDSLMRSACSVTTALRRPVLHGVVGQLHVRLLQRRLL